MRQRVDQEQDGPPAASNGHLTMLQKAAIIQMHMEGYSHLAIHEALGHARETIKLWVERFKATGEVGDQGRTLAGSASQPPSECESLCWFHHTWHDISPYCHWNQQIKE
jgi:hypothetical protein